MSSQKTLRSFSKRSGWNGVRYERLSSACCMAKDSLGLVQAPGEAEAELASLNAQGLVDAIMTDDCDAFIFGARTLIKK